MLLIIEAIIDHERNIKVKKEKNPEKLGNRGHDMMHRSVLIIYDQQFIIATITTDHV